MIKAVSLIFQFQLVLLILALLLFIVNSILEHEKLAVKRVLLLLLFALAVYTAHFFNLVPFIIQLSFLIVFLSLLILVFSPFGNRTVVFQIPKNKFDERDIMFSRMELVNGTDKFEKYYLMRPGNKPKDDLFRKEPGLLNGKSKFYNPFLFNAAKASFSTVELLHPLVEKSCSHQKSNQYTESEITEFIKNWTIKLGAAAVGFTILKPHHIYSHIGRGENYGKELELNHKYAIAFTVEMSHESMSHSPQGPIIAESAQQYLKAGTIAVQLAEFIRNLGFEARAHIDANYRVICPVVAMDAGLGSIGRMGLLMTPKLGPRVRIGVVTTNLEVEINKKQIDSSVIHFCEICRKCAINCPSNSISFKSSKKEKQFERWTIDQEACFTYWTKVGTDCGRCISVCPYAHNNNFLHNSVRYMLKINSLNRWLALKLDNYFYGKKPPIVPLKSWMSSKVD